LNKSKLAFQQTEQFSIQSIEENRIFPLEAVMTLVSELNRKKIRYCHWKSNSRLDWGLAGRTDLDLLIDPKHEKLFRDILMSLDIKRIIAPPDNQYPGLQFSAWGTICKKLSNTT
jgi:hypothetical protein